MSAPTCATCTRFRPGARMLDPKTGQSELTGQCTIFGFGAASESCDRHEPRDPPPAPALAAA